MLDFVLCRYQKCSHYYYSTTLSIFRKMLLNHSTEKVRYTYKYITNGTYMHTLHTAIQLSLNRQQIICFYSKKHLPPSSSRMKKTTSTLIHMHSSSSSSAQIVCVFWIHPRIITCRRRQHLRMYIVYVSLQTPYTHRPSIYIYISTSAIRLNPKNAYPFLQLNFSSISAVPTHTLTYTLMHYPSFRSFRWFVTRSLVCYVYT